MKQSQKYRIVSCHFEISHNIISFYGKEDLYNMYLVKCGQQKLQPE